MSDISADAFLVLIAQPGMYEGTLVAASVASTLAAYLGWLKIGKPWWEAKTMKEAREKETNHTVATNTFWMLKGLVADGELSVDEGAMYVRRFANCLPLAEILPGGLTNLKQNLQEKHLKEEVTTAENVVPLVPSLLKRLSNAKRSASTT